MQSISLAWVIFLNLKLCLSKLNQLPAEEFCQWLLTDCPSINSKYIPSPSFDIPINVQIHFNARRLLFIDEIEQKFAKFELIKSTLI